MLLAEPEGFRHMRAIVERRHLAEQAVVTVGDAFLVDRRLAALRIERRRHEIPHLLLQWQFGLEIVDFLAVADPEFEMAALVDAEAVADVLVVVPAPDDALAQAGFGQARKDIGKESDAAGESEKAFWIGNLEIGADLRILLLHRPGAVGVAGDLFLDEAWPVRMLVAMNEPNQRRLRLISPVGIDMHGDRLTRPDRDPIGVSK